MRICAAGDTHGALDRLFADVIAFERAITVTFDWILHVGDFGVWPDAARIDKASRHHDGAGDFPRWFAANEAAPRKTVFVKGNHEDFVWLDSRPTAEVLPGLHYLRNGSVFEITAAEEVLRIGGIGGCYGPSDFDRPARSLQGYAKRHYTKGEVEALVQQPGIDVILTHDAPAGVRFERHRRGAGFVSESRGLDEVLTRTRPRVCFFGHHHTRVESDVAGVPCVGLNKVGQPGQLLAFEMHPGEQDWKRLGEWPSSEMSTAIGADGPPYRPA